MNGMALESPGDPRSERELAYYKRELNDLGARLIRAQEEHHRCFREAQRSRIIVKMVRELYGIAHVGAASTSLSDLALEVVADNAMCSCAALFRERERRSSAFTLISAVGLPPADRPPLLQLRSTPTFAYTTAMLQSEPNVLDIASFLEMPYILWVHDVASGYALALGNRSEANASRPFEEADQALVDTALTVFLDVETRTPQLFIGMEAGASADIGATEEGGVEGGEALRYQLRNGGRVMSVLVVERPSSDGCDYVPYLRVTWKPGWHVLRAYRNRGDRVYRNAHLLFQMVRSDFEFMGPIAIYALETPELQTVPAVAAREHRLIQEASSRN